MKVAINGYTIGFNDYYNMYQVSHKNIGCCIAEFKTLEEAKEYCING